MMIATFGTKRKVPLSTLDSGSFFLLSEDRDQIYILLEDAMPPTRKRIARVWIKDSAKAYLGLLDEKSDYTSVMVTPVIIRADVIEEEDD